MEDGSYEGLSQPPSSEFSDCHTHISEYLHLEKEVNISVVLEY